ncbi:MAG TPA: hypothetical protein VEA58_00655 [Anaerovoracaceae bacterium]|nr:hypothetical protein [Anaerovoracaceae bacterium]
MKKSEYLTLTTSDQLDAIGRQGVYVGKRKVNDQIVLLYQLHGYYVEVYYEQYRRVVSKMAISDDASVLDPYMDQIGNEPMDGI